MGKTIWIVCVCWHCDVTLRLRRRWRLRRIWHSLDCTANLPWEVVSCGSLLVRDIKTWTLRWHLSVGYDLRFGEWQNFDLRQKKKEMAGVDSEGDRLGAGMRRAPLQKLHRGVDLKTRSLIIYTRCGTSVSSSAAAGSASSCHKRY